MLWAQLDHVRQSLCRTRNLRHHELIGRLQLGYLRFAIAPRFTMTISLGGNR